ncbi:hypothetical protein [uncultured Gimesia sp.]|uniref:alpha/beta hydrolase family protein n=1 Tax=uncultured Gimesia sp. TaxID=1678688 RepID=UPI0030D83005|tara:strand:- start:190339 stop:191379 length:1041 start_codon:yes stop_codon:yes gene_type:complete
MIRKLWSTCVDEVLGFYLLHRFFYYRKQPLIVSNAGESSPELHSGDLATFFSPVPLAAQLKYQPRLRPASKITFEAAEVEDFSFRSSIQTTFPENDLAKGRHWKSTATSRKTGSSPRYTVIAIDGIVQMGVRSFNLLAQRLTPCGVDVVMLDSPFNYRRTPAGYRPGQLIAGGNLDHQLTVARQGILDLWSLILTLQNQGHQIGLMGISHGAWMTLTAALLIDQLEFVMAITPPVDLFHILEEGGTVVNAIRRGIEHDPTDLEHLEQLTRPLVVANWKPRLNTASIHLHVADFDRFVPSFRIDSLAEQWQAKSSHHRLGHIEATTGPKVVTQVAEDILYFWNLKSH